MAIAATNCRVSVSCCIWISIAVEVCDLQTKSDYCWAEADACAIAQVYGNVNLQF